MDDKLREVFIKIANLSEKDFERYCDIIDRKREDTEIVEFLHNYMKRLEKLRS